MKINLGCGMDVRRGFVNVDRNPQGDMPTDLYRQGDIGSLDWLTEDRTVDEIVAANVVQYLKTSQVQEAIANWANKLASGGLLKILVPDCYTVAKAFYQGQLNLPDFLNVIFGTQENNDCCFSAIDTQTLCDILTEAGLSIVVKRYDGVEIYVEAQKT